MLPQCKIGSTDTHMHKKMGFITNKLCDLGQSSLMPLGFSFSICKIAGFYLTKWSQSTL